MELSFNLYVKNVFFGVIHFHVDEIDLWLVKTGKGLYRGAFNRDARYILIGAE